MIPKTFFILTLFAVASFARSSVIWDESVQGDLSGDRLAPVNLQLTNGSNQLIGTTGNSDRDYFHFHLEQGQSLTNIFLQDYISDDDFAFLGVQEGTIITEDPTDADVSHLLGWCL